MRLLPGNYDSIIYSSNFGFLNFELFYLLMVKMCIFAGSFFKLCFFLGGVFFIRVFFSLVLLFIKLFCSINAYLAIHSVYQCQVRGSVGSQVLQDPHFR